MTETAVTLLTDTWAVLLEALGTAMPKASDKIVQEIDGKEWGVAASVNAAVAGWLRVAEVIESDNRMKDVAWMLRRQCEAAIAASNAERRGL